MSDLKRIKRIVGSWVGKARFGKKRRLSVYQDDDALLILNDLGLQMSPAALDHIAGNSTTREDFLIQIYAVEDDLGLDLIKDNIQIDPALEPKVYEEDGKITFTINWKKEDYLVAEFACPKNDA